MEADKEPLLVGSDDSKTGISITASFPDSTKRTYDLPKDACIDDLKEMVETDTEIKIPENKSIAFLFMGRVLKPEQKWADLGQAAELFVSAIFRNTSQPSTSQPCQPLEPQGFDRLVRMNYTPEQIETFRRSFHALRGSSDDTPEARMELEEEWLPVIFSSGSAEEALEIRNYEDSDDTILELIFGTVLGITFGPAALLILAVSLQTKGGIGGILTGILIRLLWEKFAQ